LSLSSAPSAAPVFYYCALARARLLGESDLLRLRSRRCSPRLRIAASSPSISTLEPPFIVLDYYCFSCAARSSTFETASVAPDYPSAAACCACLILAAKSCLARSFCSLFFRRDASCSSLIIFWAATPLAELLTS